MGMATLWISTYRKRVTVKLPKPFWKRRSPTETIGRHGFCAWMAAGFTLQPFAICKPKADYTLAGAERANTPTIGLSQITEA